MCVCMCFHHISRTSFNKLLLMQLVLFPLLISNIATVLQEVTVLTLLMSAFAKLFATLKVQEVYMIFKEI